MQYSKPCEINTKANVKEIKWKWKKNNWEKTKTTNYIKEIRSWESGNGKQRAKAVGLSISQLYYISLHFHPSSAFCFGHRELDGECWACIV